MRDVFLANAYEPCAFVRHEQNAPSLLAGDEEDALEDFADEFKLDDARYL